MRRSLVLLGIVASLVIAACDSDRRAISRDDLPDVPAEPTVMVEIGDDGFEPARIEIAPTDLVEFRNTGDEEHGIRTEDYAIDTGPLFPDETTVIIFDTPGDYVVLDSSGDATDDQATMDVAVREAVNR